ncbi:hypothetical protein [Methanohalobium sp.]|uniref:hypothetical protein n=1 Tax=Methanohalobium sp. TaxID=2837493 RepID=UPI002601032F|nr:hypothetical protein [Methanohalobium sp.]
MMRKRIYHRPPGLETHFEQQYRYYSDLQYLLKILAGMTGKFGMFESQVSHKQKNFQLKREIGVEIVTNGVDFEPIDNKNINRTLSTIEPEGAIDFRINLSYSYLDDNYSRVPFRNDSYIVRVDLRDDLLTLKISHHEGPGYTESRRIADTIFDEIRRGSCG